MQGSLQACIRGGRDERRGAITWEFVFADFMQAFAFIRQLTLYAQKHNHDPEWFNVYYRADMTLTTHDVGGLSQRDIDVAIYSDQAFDRISSQTGTH